MSPWRLARRLALAALLASAADVGAQAPPPAGVGVRLDGERISVRVNQVPLRTVLEAVAAEARLELDVRGEGDRLVTASLDGLRLEAALDRILGGNFVLASGRLVVFLPGGERGQHPDRRAPPSETDRADAASAAPAGGPAPLAATERWAFPAAPGSGGAGAVVAPGVSGSAVPSPALRPLESASEPPATTGDLRGRRRPTKPGGIVIVRPPAAARSSHVLDDQEARRLASEIDARVADPPEVDVTDIPAIRSPVPRALP